MNISASYVAAVHANKDNALVPFEAMKAAFATMPTYQEQLGYSIVHMRADGTAATSLANVATVSMPHVLARGDGGAPLAARMKSAGFVKDGLCKNRTDVTARQTEAKALATKLWATFGKPEKVVAVVAQPKAKKEVPIVVTPTEA